ncbi:MAG: hypothetical protein WC373_08520 [Smithella sp.]|jgi:hypothetical protein
MTNEQLNEFFALLQGRKMHPWEPENEREQNITPDGELSYSFRKYLEKQMPVVWEEYLKQDKCVVYLRPFMQFAFRLTAILDPQNLFDFLNTHLELWCNVCDECGGSGLFRDAPVETLCPKCGGATMTHPALEWLEKMEEHDE